MNNLQRAAPPPAEASVAHPWDAELFLRFEAERAWPARDLVARIEAPARLAFDLGCGPGTSTRLLRERFPQARISGVDASEPMLAEARRRLPGVEFEQRGHRALAPAPAARSDLRRQRAAMGRRSRDACFRA